MLGRPSHHHIRSYALAGSTAPPGRGHASGTAETARRLESFATCQRDDDTAVRRPLPALNPEGTCEECTGAAIAPLAAQNAPLACALHPWELGLFESRLFRGFPGAKMRACSNHSRLHDTQWLLRDDINGTSRLRQRTIKESGSVDRLRRLQREKGPPRRIKRRKTNPLRSRCTAECTRAPVRASVPTTRWSLRPEGDRRAGTCRPW